VFGVRSKQAKTILNQCRMNHRNERYRNDPITAMESLDGLSLAITKRKK